MKTNKIVVQTLWLTTMLLSVFSQAQNFGVKSSAGTASPEVWQPLKLSDDGNNKLNNVAFFRLKSQCNAEEAMLLRLVNSNAYPVKVEWQLSPESSKVYVIVPATTDMQGSCPSVNDKNLTNLAVKIPKTEEERQKIKEYFLSHLLVSEIKK